MEFLNSDVFAWVILPILIFMSRIIDQTIGTLRVIFTAKGFRSLAPIFAFFESLIWLMAISQIMRHLDNPMCYLAYAGGFGAGNFFGITLEERLSVGISLVRIVPNTEDQNLKTLLLEKKYKINSIEVDGINGGKEMLLIVLKRKEAKLLLEFVKNEFPNSFYTLEDVRDVNRKMIH